MGRRNYKQESGSESLVYDFFRRAWALGSEERSLGRCTIERPECRMHWMGRQIECQSLLRIHGLERTLQDIAENKPHLVNDESEVLRDQSSIEPLSPRRVPPPAPLRIKRQLSSP